MNFRRLSAFWTVLLLLTSSHARAWDPYGHMIVCQIAYNHLTHQAKQAVDELASQVPFPGTVYTPVTVGCWMDDIRDPDPKNPFSGKFKAWHYITWGLEPGDASPPLTTAEDETKAGNVVIGLKRSLAVLQGGEDPEIPNKAIALAILCHLVGDVHQPLHCASHFFEDKEGKIINDSGGNRVTIDNSTEVTLPNGKKAKANLHSFWDESYRGEFNPESKLLLTNEALKDYTQKDMQALASMVAAIQDMQPAPDTSMEPDFEAWGRESNTFARDYAYPKLPRFKLNRYADVDAPYVSGAREIADQRLVLAGYRLAALLNKTLGQEQ